MKSDELNDLMDKARRRVLHPDDRKRVEQLLEADPAAWPDWKEDMALTQLLDGIPDAPVATNFTSRVMQAVALEDSRTKPRGIPLTLYWLTHSWFARLGIVTSVAIAAVLGWQQNQKWERAALAESMVTISEVAAVPSVEILKDFEVIQSLGAVPPAAEVEADLTLLAALE